MKRASAAQGIGRFGAGLGPWMSGIASLVGLVAAGCSVPQYRIEAQNIPQGTASLQVAAYVQGQLAADSPVVELDGTKDRVTFGLSLGGSLQGDATISVAARRADGCLLAVGTSLSTSPSSTGADVTIPLFAPDPAVSDTVCLAQPPVILAVIRRQEGPLQNIQFSLMLQGWGFQPTVQASLASTARVQCVSGSACSTACATSCSGSGGGGPGNGTCLTDCPIVADVLPIGPGLTQLSLDPAKNILQLPTMGSAGVQPIDLLQLLSQPLRITLTLPGSPASSVTFTEQAAQRGQIGG